MVRESVFKIVRDIILEILPDLSGEQITQERSLKELGANSVDRMEIVTMSMETLRIKIPMASFGNLSNIGELVTVLATAAST